MERHIAVPFSEEELKELHAGDYIYLTGTIYSARDAAHKRMYDAICVEQEKQEIQSIISDQHRQSRDRSSVPQDLPRAAVWINIHRFCCRRD